MTNHSRLSPSSRHRWQLCPGSVREEAKYPDTPGKASIDGTHSHTLLEMCLNHVKDAWKYVGNEYEDHDGKFVVDADRAERVQVALDYVRSRRTVIQGKDNVITERRVHPSKTTGRDDLSGTVDVQIHEPDLVEIIDYKDGMSPVEAKNNPQLEQYALGVIDDHNLPQDCLIKMTIIQPKLRIKGLEPITSHVMTVKELREIVAPKLVLEAAATDDPNAPLVPGDVQCKYCKAKGGCSALAAKVMDSVGFKPIIQFGDRTVEKSKNWDEMFAPNTMSVTVETSDTVAQQSDSQIHPHQGCYQSSDVEWVNQEKQRSVAQQSANKDPTTMTNEQLVELLEAAPLMRQMLDAAETEALVRAKAGQVVPGYKIVNGPGSRAWVHDEEEMAAKLVKMGIPKSAIYVTKLVSPPQAEKLMWEKKGVKTTLSEKQLKRMETEYVKKSKGRLTLVPESDPRPAAVVDAAPLFSPVVEIPDWLK